MNLVNFVLAATQADWITKSFPIIRYVLIGIIFVCAIIMTITVLLQSENSSGGTNVISGVQESYYSQNKGETRDGKLKKTTIIMGVLENIKEEDRKIFMNYYYHSKKIKDISRQLNISEIKVKSRLSRIRKKLKKELEKRGYGYERK